MKGSYVSANKFLIALNVSSLLKQQQAKAAPNQREEIALRFEKKNVGMATDLLGNITTCKMTIFEPNHLDNP